MTSVTLSSGEQTATAFVINSEIGIVGNRPPYVARPYARSRSETMPSIDFPSLLTTRAPICSARICPESRSAVSCGGTVFTTDPLIRKMSATFMAPSMHENSSHYRNKNCVPMLQPRQEGRSILSQVKSVEDGLNDVCKRCRPDARS